MRFGRTGSRRGKKVSQVSFSTHSSLGSYTVTTVRGVLPAQHQDPPPTHSARPTQDRGSPSPPAPPEETGAPSPPPTHPNSLTSTHSPTPAPSQSSTTAPTPAVPRPTELAPQAPPRPWPPAPLAPGVDPKTPRTANKVYDAVVAGMLSQAQHKFECLLFTEDAYPNIDVQIRWSLECWEAVCSGTRTYFELSKEMLSLVRPSLPLLACAAR